MRDCLCAEAGGGGPAGRGGALEPWIPPASWSSGPIICTFGRFAVLGASPPRD